MHIIKRILSVFIALLLLPGLASAEAPADINSDFDRRAMAWELIIQGDPRYQTYEYRFNFDDLSVRGCGPVSVTNALLATFGVSDREVTDVFLKETLMLMADYHSAKNHGMTINNVDAFITMDDATYPTLYACKQALSPNSCFSPRTLTAEELQSALEPMIASGEGAISFSKLSTKEWITIAQLCHWLNEIGKEEAIITLSVVSGGTATSGTPFSDDSDGHYLTLLVHVGEYMRRGSVYLIDSLPRAIANEAFSNSTYWRPYYFASSLSHSYSFRHTYSIRRIQDTIIKMELLPEHQEALSALTGEDRLWHEAKLLKEIQTYGLGLLTIFVPGTNSEGRAAQ